MIGSLAIGVSLSLKPPPWHDDLADKLVGVWHAPLSTDVGGADCTIFLRDTDGSLR